MDFFGAQDTILWYKNAPEVRYKTTVVKFKISNNFRENFVETN